MRTAARLAFLLAAIVLLSPATQAVTFIGSISTADLPPEVVGSGGSWSDNFMIRWEISDDPTTGLWTYQYWVTQEDGVSALGTNGQQGGLSHWDLEISSGLTEADFTILTGNSVEIGYDPTSVDPQFYGIKFTPNGDQTYFAFTVNRAPVWGDFFAKDGDKGGYAWNSGYGLPDSMDPYASITGKVLRPDTSPTTATPEPGTMLLMGLGMVGAGIMRRLRK